MKVRYFHHIIRQYSLFIFIITLAGCAVTSETDDLIPRTILFSNPERSSPQLSPDGKMLAYLASDNNYPALYVKTVGKNDDRLLTDANPDQILSFFWQPDGVRLIYQIRKIDGGSIWIYALPLAGGSPIGMTPIPGIQTKIVAVSPDHPSRILYSMNNKAPQIYDVYELNLNTQESVQVVSNDIGAVLWIADHTLTVRIGLVPLRNGNVKMMHRKDADSEWETELEWIAEDALNTRPYAFDKDNQTLYMLSSVGSNTVELRSYNLLTKETYVIGSDPNYDLTGVMIEPRTYNIQAVKFVAERADWQIKDQSLKVHFEAVSSLQRGDFSVIDRDLNNQTWIVSFIADDSPQTYYTYNLKTQQGTLLFRTNDRLHKRKLARTESLTINSRDNKSLLCYLTKPFDTGVGIPPTLVLVHDGPWIRDTWGMNPQVQWLVDRGYNVFQVNYRGSSGFGKQFQNACDKEWGGKIQDDITDATNYLIEQKIADPDRIGIIGTSYGGFAVLAALTKTPDLFACGVDLFGSANLISWIGNLPARLKGSLPQLHQRIGDPAEDRDMLIDRSPISHFDQIKSPLMIVQGAKDERIPKSETQLIVKTLRSQGMVTEYMEFPNEGHGFSRLENKLACYAKIEKFLAEHLGGKVESYEMTISSED